MQKLIQSIVRLTGESEKQAAEKMITERKREIRLLMKEICWLEEYKKKVS